MKKFTLTEAESYRDYPLIHGLIAAPEMLDLLISSPALRALSIKNQKHIMKLSELHSQGYELNNLPLLREAFGSDFSRVFSNLEAISARQIKDWIDFVAPKVQQFELLKKISKVDDTFSLTETQQALHSALAESELNAHQKIQSMSEALQSLIEVKTKESLISTGIATMDFHTGGIPNTALAILGAETGTGKTTFALNLALSISYSVPVFYASGEETNAQLAQKMLPMMSAFTAKQLRASKYSAELLSEIELAKEAVPKNIYLHYGFGGVDELLLQIKIAKQKHGIKIAFIDHLQCLDGSHDYGTYAEITRKLKNFALRNEIAIFAVSQLNSNYVTRATKKLSEHDLRGGKNAAQDADLIFFYSKRDEGNVFTFFKDRSAELNKPSEYLIEYNPAHKLVTFGESL